VNAQARAVALPTAVEGGAIRPLKYWTWWMPVVVAAWGLVLVGAFPDAGGLIRRHWPLFGVGFLGAVLGNATAVGGGLVFIPVFILAYALQPVTALKVALASQCFGMTSGAIGWMTKRAVPTRALLVAIPPMLVGSTISSLVVHPNPLLVKGLFGPASIFIGLVTLYLLDRDQGRESVPAGAYLPLMAFSLVGGTLTGWVAIGEGEVIAAFLMLAYGLRAERGIGMGVVLLSINSIYLTLVHQFLLDGIPWEIAMFTGLGCVFGGRLGPRLSHWVGPYRLKIGFAIVAIIDGSIFLLQFLLSGP